MRVVVPSLQSDVCMPASQPCSIPGSQSDLKCHQTRSLPTPPLSLIQRAKKEQGFEDGGQGADRGKPKLGLLVKACVSVGYPGIRYVIRPTGFVKWWI